MELSIREIITSDIAGIVDYWVNSSREHLKGMGADPDKIPNRDYFENALKSQIETDYRKKDTYASVWLVNDKPIGHCNVNEIKFGESANMHLHIWNPNSRNKGIGAQLVKKSLLLFFEKLELQWISCEPYTHNPAPHKALEKIGFKLEREYVTIPGSINFEQPVKRWVITKDKIMNV